MVSKTRTYRISSGTSGSFYNLGLDGEKNGISTSRVYPEVYDVSLVNFDILWDLKKLKYLWSSICHCLLPIVLRHWKVRQKHNRNNSSKVKIFLS